MEQKLQVNNSWDCLRLKEKDKTQEHKDRRNLEMDLEKEIIGNCHSNDHLA